MPGVGTHVLDKLEQETYNDVYVEAMVAVFADYNFNILDDSGFVYAWIFSDA